MRIIGFITENWKLNKSGKQYTFIQKIDDEHQEFYVKQQDFKSSIEQEIKDTIVFFDEKKFDDGKKVARKVKFLNDELRNVPKEMLLENIERIYSNIERNDFKVKFILSIPEDILITYLDEITALCENIKKYSHFSYIDIDKKFKEISGKKYEQFFKDISEENLLREIRGAYSSIKNDDYKCKFILFIPDNFFLNNFDVIIEFVNINQYGAFDFLPAWIKVNRKFIEIFIIKNESFF